MILPAVKFRNGCGAKEDIIAQPYEWIQTERGGISG